MSARTAANRSTTGVKREQGRADDNLVSLHPVFHDPTGRRSKSLRVASVALFALIALLGGSFALGVLNPPVVEPLPISKAGVAKIERSGRRNGRGGCPRGRRSQLPALLGGGCVSSPWGRSPVGAPFAGSG